jgi:hypothetical protein
MCDAVSYVVKNGVEWRSLPVGFPPWEACTCTIDSQMVKALDSQMVKGHDTVSNPPSKLLYLQALRRHGG